MTNTEGLATRITADEKGRYVLWIFNGRKTETKRYAEYAVAQAMALRVQENGTTRRGFTA